MWCKELCAKRVRTILRLRLRLLAKRNLTRYPIVIHRYVICFINIDSIIIIKLRILFRMKDRWWDEDKHVFFSSGLGRDLVVVDEFGGFVALVGRREGKVDTQTSKDGSPSATTMPQKHRILKTCSRTEPPPPIS